ncbi:hypothetical protein IE81DRAFT_319194 [Ceraceosorus guamensis]|uniref:Nuclear pore complex NUP2/50/61 domain-containing protein n=1 Tax=Ceraceosorus guamensis TaxID=1522189 RepID=A0A316WBJ3_9BASI|nr:hypothetical protein IE81DRAFT_319194 [Ceraceosorus guamensis]PWN46308.1 hypothetical protein IE81DRAFT_319194 [Ceraceosorus guamensis]
MKRAAAFQLTSGSGDGEESEEGQNGSAGGAGALQGSGADRVIKGMPRRKGSGPPGAASSASIAAPSSSAPGRTPFSFGTAASPASNASSVQGNAFGASSGIASAPATPATLFSFGSSSTSSATSQVTSSTSRQSSAESYYLKLRGLNHSLSSALEGVLKADPFADLTHVLAELASDYKRHRSSTDALAGPSASAARSTETSSTSPAVPPSPTVSNPATPFVSSRQANTLVGPPKAPTTPFTFGGVPAGASPITPKADPKPTLLPGQPTFSSPSGGFSFAGKSFGAPAEGDAQATKSVAKTPSNSSSSASSFAFAPAAAAKEVSTTITKGDGDVSRGEGNRAEGATSTTRTQPAASPFFGFGQAHAGSMKGVATPHSKSAAGDSNVQSTSSDKPSSNGNFNKSGTFGFGSSSTPATHDSAAKDAATKPIFAFGSAPAASSTPASAATFGSGSVSTTNPVSTPFSFGAKAANAAESASGSSASKPAAASPFGFGSASGSSSSNNLRFSFGSSSASSTDPSNISTNATPNVGASKSTFSFGASSSPSAGGTGYAATGNTKPGGFQFAFGKPLAFGGSEQGSADKKDGDDKADDK